MNLEERIVLLENKCRSLQHNLINCNKLLAEAYEKFGNFEGFMSLVEEKLEDK